MIEGILGRKIGMTQVFTKEGAMVGVTAIEVGPCIVTQIKTQAKDGYEAVQLGFIAAKKLNKPEAGHLKKARMLRHLKEFRVSELAEMQVGQNIDVGIFKAGDKIDVTGFSKGKGFAGGVKRHNFRGGPKTHGQSDRLRGPGSIGSTTQPGRVLKGKHMAGHMGNEKVTTQNLTVVEADPSRNILLVEGAVPGGKNGILVIMKVKSRQ
ncbi:MAG: 50S ribosomal protein L3 [Chloroflexi bacterium]|nr:50S ribosomal protein L3 [Chloroflexota bacterium]